MKVRTKTEKGKTFLFLVLSHVNINAVGNGRSKRELAGHIREATWITKNTLEGSHEIHHRNWNLLERISCSRKLYTFWIVQIAQFVHNKEGHVI